MSACFYVRVAGPLLQNLLFRIGGEMADIAVGMKRRLLYPIKRLLSRYDDVLPPDDLDEIEERTPTPEAKKVTNLPPPPPQKPPDRPVVNQRPLPPTPETNKPILDHNSVTLRKPPRPNVSHMPWFHNVDRKQAEELLKNSENGTFLLRPTTQTQNVFTLTLWYNRLYNISVRLRSDGKYALGTEKPKEQAFSTVEELVTNYQSEKLVLYSGGERTGQTLLVNTPPKRELF